jgi:glycosyltransferase involved in cell wall biosynthesis
MSRSARAALHRQLRIPAGAEVLLSVGPVRQPKCQSLLVHAFREVARPHPNALLVLLGDANHPYADAIRDWTAAAGLGDRVRFEPATPDIRPWYHAADWLVVPSDVESLPRTIVEAVASGVPVASTDVGGIRELVDGDTTGFLCPPNDLEEMTRMIERALATAPERRQALASACADRARRRHAPDACVRAYADLLRRSAA